MRWFLFHSSQRNFSQLGGSVHSQIRTSVGRSRRSGNASEVVLLDGARTLLEMGMRVIKVSSVIPMFRAAFVIHCCVKTMLLVM